MKAAIFNADSDIIMFKYKYIYCYFVSQYLHQHITEKSIQIHIVELTHKLYNEQAANIIMFLCHLSMDDFLVNNILDGALKIFPEQPECNLKEDVEFLKIEEKELFESLPDNNNDDNNYDENRRNMLKKQDTLNGDDDEETYLYPTATSSTKIEGVPSASHVNAAFKTTQILGQILKNFHGKMVGPKKEIVAGACLSLTKRTISSFLNNVKFDKKDFVEMIEQKIRENQPELVNSEVKIKSNKYLFDISEFIVLSMVKHCSDSIGLPVLSPLYDNLFSKTEKQNTPDKILSMSIKLDYYGQFPIDDLQNILQDKNVNFFSKTIIRHLVWLNLYLYPVDYSLRQRIGTILNIDGTQKAFIKTKQKLLPSEYTKKPHKNKKRKKRR